MVAYIKNYLHNICNILIHHYIIKIVILIITVHKNYHRFISILKKNLMHVFG